MVEVTQYHLHTAAHFAQGVRNRHTDVIEGNVRGAGGGGISRLDGFGFDGIGPGDQDDGVTVLCSVSGI